MKIKLHKDRKFIFVEMFSEENRCWSDLFVRLGFLFVLLCFFSFQFLLLFLTGSKAGVFSVHSFVSISV